MIFVGGFSKSGTTFIARALGLFNQVSVKGELDYFRQFFDQMNLIFNNFNTNINVVNQEVYDGRGTLVPVDDNMMIDMHRDIFKRLFSAGTPVPAESQFWVEKSPHNIYWTNAIHAVFPEARILSVYREPKAVFRSLIRQLSDHRDEAYTDPQSKVRQKSLKSFVHAWDIYVQHLETKQDTFIMVQCQRVVDNVQGFMAFAERQVLQQKLGLARPLETLSKEYYLQTLPQAARAKSLVQIGPNKVKLSRAELEIIESRCRAPNLTFDF